MPVMDGNNNRLHMQHGSFMQRRIARNPRLKYKLDQMALNLSPLVQVTTGYVHPWFPKTMLQFWLLTNDQLDSLAHFYHQRTPCEETMQYPCPILWDPALPIKEKRRQIGKFIGLRICETPNWLAMYDGPWRPFSDGSVECVRATNSIADRGWAPHYARVRKAQNAERRRMDRLEEDRARTWGHKLSEDQIAERARLMRNVLAEEEMLKGKNYPYRPGPF